MQFAPCSGGTVGQQLVAHDGVDAVILTGGTATAAEMLAHKPTMHLLAETGGKNATIVTALSDRDQAIKNVLHSAFSHSGQKCSATSLLILESEVYHDAEFPRRACATPSKACTSARRGTCRPRLGPLIRPPTGALETGLKELEPGEEWAVMPRLHVDGNPHLVSPGVKWGVQPSSFTHCTEFFGPVLGVMEARDLDEAIDLVNATGYGLTSGLESLDDREQELWREPDSRRQPLHQSPHDRRDRAAATVRRHGQEQRRPRHQSGRPELRRAADAFRGKRGLVQFCHRRR